jgi:xanthine dehydrogenase accessory factor
MTAHWMTAHWLRTIVDMVADSAVVRVVVIRAEGSTPRDAGAAMLVTELGQSGTIGGGALEFDAIKAARALLDQADTTGTARWLREVREYPLGPALCQCCGGFAWVLFELFTPAERGALQANLDRIANASGYLARQLISGGPLSVYIERADTATLPETVAAHLQTGLSGTEALTTHLIEGAPSVPAWFVEPVSAPSHVLYLYGAGHVGREVVRVTAGLGFDIRWVDTEASRFPHPIASHAQRIISSEPAETAASAEVDALHLVMTYSHPMDEAICRALLLRDEFAFLGLIGSKTKRARFAQRLLSAGVTKEQLARLVSPIGIDGLTGKEPAAIAVSVAVQLLQVLQTRAFERRDFATAKPRRVGAPVVV